MIEFITHPQTEKVSDKYWKLTEDFIVKYNDFTYVVPEGFLTDFASVPKIPVIYQLLHDKAKVSAIFHDWLYSEKPCTRREADLAFLEAMEEEGLNFPTRMAMYKGVRLGGWAYWRK